MEMECKSSMLMVNPEEICQEPSRPIGTILDFGTNYGGLKLLCPCSRVAIYRYNLDKDQLLKAWD